MDVSKVIFAKLNVANYFEWATLMKALLQAKDFREYVNSNGCITTATDPTGTSGNDSAKEKISARAMITCCIEAEFGPMVAAKPDPKEVWNALANSNRSKRSASMQICNTLLNMRMGQEISIRNFLNEICTIQREVGIFWKNYWGRRKEIGVIKWVMWGICNQENYLARIVWYFVRKDSVIITDDKRRT